MDILVRIKSIIWIQIHIKMDKKCGEAAINVLVSIEEETIHLETKNKFKKKLIKSSRSSDLIIIEVKRFNLSLAVILKDFKRVE